MKLDQIGSFDKDIRVMRIFNYLILVLLILAGCGMTIYFANKQDETIQRKRIVIDAENRPMIATERALTKAERFEQYKRFWEDWYNMGFAFDAGSFQRNLDRALNCMTKDVGNSFYIKEYKEKPLAREVIENNWKMQAQVLRIEFLPNTNPVKGKVYGRQSLIRPSGITVRNMSINFTIDDVSVTYENPYGVMIQYLDIFDNTPLRDSTVVN